MNLEDIIYQSLFYFSFFLFGIVGLSFFIHLFRKQPVKKFEINDRQTNVDTKNELESELIIAAKKREEIIAEAQRKRAIQIAVERRKEEFRRSRYSVVKVNQKKKAALPKPMFNCTIIEDRTLDFYQ